MAISNVANTPRCYEIPLPYCSACVLYNADVDNANDGEDCDYDENGDDNDDDNDDDNLMTLKQRGRRPCNLKMEAQ